AAFSDKVGRKAVMLSGFVLSSFLVPVAFYGILHLGNPLGLTGIHTIGEGPLIKIVLLIISLHICCAMVYGPLGAFILELFPTQIRFTSMGFTYNIGNGVLGGSTAFVTELLRSITLAGAAMSPFVGLVCP